MIDEEYWFKYLKDKIEQADAEQRERQEKRDREDLNEKYNTKSFYY